MVNCRLSRSALFLVLCLVTFASPKCQAESDFLKQGMAEYAKGNYVEASGRFGGALSTDFNNATLHYFLGSCYAHMKQKDDAVREFRIAYALAPEKEVGQFAKQALSIYGFDTTGAAKTGGLPGSVSAQGARKPQAPGGEASSFASSRATALLQQQAEELKNLRAEQSRQASIEAGNHSDKLIQRKTDELLDASRYITRRGRIIQPTRLSGDDQRNIESLKRLYEAQKSSYIEAGERQKAEIQNTAQSLQQQINEQVKGGKVHLSPAGTNLYVRNYEVPRVDNKSTQTTSNKNASSK